MSEHTAGDVLRMAGHLLADQKRRCTLEPARNVHGRLTGYADYDACSWCVIGAAAVAALRLNPDPAVWEQVKAFLMKAAGVKTGQGLANAWNHGGERRRDTIAAKLRAAP